MASWSTRRKFTYSSIVIIALILLVLIPGFYFFYKPPTCSDNIQNGKETGIDCGGSCVRLCQSSFLPPKIGWGGAKFEKVADGLYNVAAYIINPNVNGAALNVPYKISLFDSDGILIIEKRGNIDLYAHRNSLAFEPSVNVDKRVPSKAIFEFTQPPVWFKSHDELEGLVVVDKRYSEDFNNSSLEVEFENRTLYPYNNVIVTVILSNSDGNAVGFSRTIIDNISPKFGKEVAPFTWPKSRNGEVKSIEVLPMIAPILDQ